MSTSTPVTGTTDLKRVQRSVVGSYSTGKGTTARIKQFFEDRAADYQVSYIANSLNLPSRQLSKRLAEMVSSGYLEKSKNGGRNFYNRPYST